jgi:hypothetical protein
MSNLFTEVSVEQQEIVTGGVPGITLFNINELFQTNVFGYNQAVGPNGSTTNLFALTRVASIARTWLRAEGVGV